MPHRGQRPRLQRTDITNAYWLIFDDYYPRASATSGRRKRLRAGPNTVRLRPVMTSAAAASFQPGSGSLRNTAEEIMPKTGTSRAKGVIVVAGWRASSQL